MHSFQCKSTLNDYNTFEKSGLINTLELVVRVGFCEKNTEQLEFRLLLCILCVWRVDPVGFPWESLRSVFPDPVSGSSSAKVTPRVIKSGAWKRQDAPSGVWRQTWRAKVLTQQNHKETICGVAPVFEGNISQIPTPVITLFYHVLPCSGTEEMTKYKKLILQQNFWHTVLNSIIDSVLLFLTK